MFRREEQEEQEEQEEKGELNALPQQAVSSQEIVSLWREAVPSSDTNRFVSCDQADYTSSRP